MTDPSIILRCSNCGTRNRIPLSRLNDRPVCGRCKHLLPEQKPLDRPIDVTDGTFGESVLNAPGAVLVDCWAPWCGPCRMIAPVLEQLAKEYTGKVKISKLNVDENPVTAAKYAVQSIPTMLLFRNGKLINTLVGALPKNAIENHIRTLL